MLKNLETVKVTMASHFKSKTEESTLYKKKISNFRQACLAWEAEWEVWPPRMSMIAVTRLIVNGRVSTLLAAQIVGVSIVTTNAVITSAHAGTITSFRVTGMSPSVRKRLLWSNSSLK